MSLKTRIDGPGGNSHSFWAMYSLRISFWLVPASSSDATPCFSAATTYMASRTLEEALHVFEGIHGDALRADFTEGERRVGVQAHEGGHIESDREAVLAVIQEVPEPLVGLCSRPVTA